MPVRKANVNKISVAIVDGQPLVREGLMYTATSAGDFEVAMMGETATDAVGIVAKFEPDILIIELAIVGTGHQALRDIQALGKRTQVMVLTTSEEESDVLEALRCGARGYVLKSIEGADLQKALRCIYLGGSYVTPMLGARILSSISRSIQSTPKSMTGLLSKREASVYSLIRQGYSNKEIGRSLNLSEKTIKHYLTNMYRKLEVSNRLELAVLT